MRIAKRLATVAAATALAISGSGFAADEAEARTLPFDFESNICSLAAMVGINFEDCTWA